MFTWVLQVVSLCHVSPKSVCTLFISSTGGLLSAVIRLLFFFQNIPFGVSSSKCVLIQLLITHKLNVNVFLSTIFGFNFQPSSGHYTRTDLLLFLCSGLTMARIQGPELFARISASILCVCDWLLNKTHIVLSILVAIHQNPLWGFGNANGFCFILHRLCVIKQWSANSGRSATGGTEIIWQLPTPSIMQFEIQQNTHYPYAGYVDPPCPLGKFVEKSTKLTCLEISRYRIKKSTILWLL
jgi:hypothetical protein